VEEAKRAGEVLKEAGFVFDCAYTSVLKRAIKTLWLALERMDLMWIPVRHSWRLNERHMARCRAEQSRNGREVRRGAGASVAA